MVKKLLLLIEWMTNSLFSEFPFFLFVYALLWQNTLFAVKECYVGDIILYSVLSVFHAFLFTAFVYICRWKFIKVLLCIIFLISCIANIFLRIRFSSNISPSVIQLMMETNNQESREFLDNYLLNYSSVCFLLLFLFMIVIYAIVEKVYRKKHAIHRHWLISILIFVFIGGCVSCVHYISMFNCKNVIELDYWIEERGAKAMDNFSNIVYCIYDVCLCNAETVKAVNATSLAYTKNSTCSETDTLNVVLVVGESYIKWHAGIYGYENETTPYLDKELRKGNLFLFQDVISPYNLTSKTLRNVFSTNSCSLGENWSDYPFFPMLFRQAGYEVTFWDNQYDPLSREGFDFSLNSYLHNSQISEMTYSATNNMKKAIDGDLVDDFFSNDECRKGRLRFSIFHLMGQHVAYYNRFPHGGLFDYFNADSIRRNDSYLNQEKRQLIADYDNATRYNDYVIYSIIQHYRQENSVIVYFSDHGEEVYDYQDFSGRNWKEPLSNDLLRFQFEVPFIIWCSDTYIKNNPKTISQIKSALCKPLMLDNVCHLMMHLGQITSTYYHPERDVLNDNYICPPRIVNDKYNVEDVRKESSIKYIIH